MVNTTCQLDWATGSPDIWPNTILAMAVRVFWGEINIWKNCLSKEDCSPYQCGWSSPNQLKTWLEPNRLSKILYHWFWFSFSGEPWLIQKGSFLNLTKNIYKKLIADIICSGKRVNAFLLKPGTRQRCLSYHSYSI